MKTQTELPGLQLREAYKIRRDLVNERRKEKKAESPKKPDEEPFDKTEFAKELSSIISNFAQVVTMIIIASQ